MKSKHFAKTINFTFQNLNTETSTGAKGHRLSELARTCEELWDNASNASNVIEVRKFRAMHLVILDRSLKNLKTRPWIL